jgi:hypothetical protein
MNLPNGGSDLYKRFSGESDFLKSLLAAPPRTNEPALPSQKQP